MKSKVWRLFALALTVCFCVHPLFAMAAVEENGQDLTRQGTAFQYAAAPEGLFPFVYEGLRPNPFKEIEPGKLHWLQSSKM